MASYVRFLSSSSGSVAEVWFHVESAGGAGLNPKMYKAVSRFHMLPREPIALN